MCYAVLATLVRLAYNEGYTTTEVIVAQYTLGLWLGIVLILAAIVLINLNTLRKEFKTA